MECSQVICCSLQVIVTVISRFNSRSIKKCVSMSARSGNYIQADVLLTRLPVTIKLFTKLVPLNAVKTSLLLDPLHFRLRPFIGLEKPCKLSGCTAMHGKSFVHYVTSLICLHDLREPLNEASVIPYLISVGAMFVDVLYCESDLELFICEIKAFTCFDCQLLHCDVRVPSIH